MPFGITDSSDTRKKLGEKKGHPRSTGVGEVVGHTGWGCLIDALMGC